VSAASWLVLLCLASISLNEAGRGVNGFGSFCLHNNGCTLRDALSKSSAAGPNHGHTEKHGDTRVRYKRSDSFTDQRFSTGKSQDTFPRNMIVLYGQNHKFCMIPPGPYFGKSGNSNGIGSPVSALRKAMRYVISLEVSPKGFMSESKCLFFPPPLL